MNQPYIRGVIEGRNSVLFETSGNTILYEKLSNTVHSGTKKGLKSLQGRVESVEYRPAFETKSLKAQKNNPIGVLLLEVTEQCNMRCDYCINSGDYSHERTYSPRRMAFDTARRALDELVPLSKGTSLIGFYGGEPLVNMGLIRQVMDYARSSFPSKGLMFSMTTNFFLGDKYIREIVTNGMYVNLSLDGPKRVHDRFRKTKRGNPTFDRIMANLRKVEEYSPGYVNSHFFVLSTCYDPNDLGDIIRFFEGEELFVSHITSVEKRGRIFERGLFPEADNNYLNVNYLDKILQGKEPGILRRLFDQDLKTIASRDESVLLAELMLHGSCYPGRKRIFVDIDGRYHPCERVGSRLQIGSVYEGIRADLSDNVIDIFADIRNNICGDCWTQRVCKPCPQYAKDSHGEISAEGLSQVCSSRRKQLIGALSSYAQLLKSDKETAEKYFKTINPLFERG